MLLAQASMSCPRGAFGNHTLLILAPVLATVARVGRAALAAVVYDALIIAALLCSLILGLLIGRRVVGGGSWRCGGRLPLRSLASFIKSFLVPRWSSVFLDIPCIQSFCKFCRVFFIFLQIVTEHSNLIFKVIEFLIRGMR
jgi:hypothetical protein